ncbi:MAG: GtrA family protein [Endomicrobium sp.]|jgi:putative flippase GtrA|nr:GtrA family protein [Endomicrobium sp.]
MKVSQSKIFILFILSGFLAAMVNIVSRWILFHYLPYVLSITIAYILGMLTAFILFKIFVFDAKQSGRTLRESLIFVIVNLLALAQTIVISVLLVDYLFPYINFTFYPYDVAHIIGTGIPVITSFFLHKYWTFKKNKPSNL